MGEYSIVSVRLDDGSEAQTFVVFEADKSKARTIARKWAADRYGRMLMEVSVESGTTNLRLVSLLVEQGKIIPAE